MKFTTLDIIVRRTLLAKRLPMHYYLEFMTHAASGLRELNIDSLHMVNTVLLSPNVNSAIDLPADYMDWVSIGIPQGQFMQPLSQRTTINNLPNVDESGNPIPYGSSNASGLTFPYFPGYWMYQNINDLGENTGRLYGWNAAAVSNTFKVIESRNQIQLSETFNGTSIIFIYVSDGQLINNATQVNVMAWAAIEQYINWKRSKNADIEESPEGRSFFNQRRLLRGRLNNITLADVRTIFYKSYRASPK